VSDQASYPDIRDPLFWELLEKSKPYSMLSVERLYHIYKSVEYVCRHDIAGDIVECGVYLGGAVMMAAEALSRLGSVTRRIFLYDTFEGFPDGVRDVALTGEVLTRQAWVTEPFRDQVLANLARTTYPAEKFVLVEGPVEQTLPGTCPNRSALVHLDTDYYQSTKHELIHLCPRLVQGGVLIIDDYGHFEGCRQATDEYFAEYKPKILLNRIDYTGRSGVKL
jgi:hypothetical protein